MKAFKFSRVFAGLVLIAGSAFVAVLSSAQDCDGVWQECVTWGPDNQVYAGYCCQKDTEGLVQCNSGGKRKRRQSFNANCGNLRVVVWNDAVKQYTCGYITSYAACGGPAAVSSDGGCTQVPCY